MRSWLMGRANYAGAKMACVWILVKGGRIPSVVLSGWTILPRHGPIDRRHTGAQVCRVVAPVRKKSQTSLRQRTLLHQN